MYQMVNHGKIVNAGNSISQAIFSIYLCFHRLHDLRNAASPNVVDVAYCTILN
jgi:hypothetical protein